MGKMCGQQEVMRLCYCFVIQKWKIMSCQMKVEQLREAVALGMQEKKSGGCQ